MDKKKIQLSLDFSDSSSEALSSKRKESFGAVLCFNSAKKDAEKKGDKNLLKLYQSYAEKIYW